MLRYIDYTFQAKAIIATEKTNCIVDFCEESIEIARNLESTPRDKRGPLFGIPLSIKECFHVKGYDHTAGLAKEIGKPSLEDGSFVKVCCISLLYSNVNNKNNCNYLYFSIYFSPFILCNLIDLYYYIN